MPAIQYPFIDIAVHDHVRHRFAAGEAIVLFSSDMDSPLWANGRGAGLFGYSSIYDFLDQGPNRADIVFRQIETTARQLGPVGEKRHLTIRVTSGFQRIAVQAVCERIEVQGKPAIVFSAPLEKARLPLASRAARMIEGFDDPDTHMAVLDADGDVIAASPQFSGLGISEQTADMLAGMAGGDGGRLVKRPIPTARGYLPAAIGRLCDEPALNLLFTVETTQDAAEAVAAEPATEPAGEPKTETGLEIEPASATPPAAGYADAIEAIAGIEDAEEPDEEISLETDAAAMHPADQPAADTPAAGTPENETPESGVTDAVGEDPVEASVEEDEPPAGFVFRRDGRSTRFVWKIDAEGRFSEVSGEFADAVGPHAADIVGMAFTDIAAQFRLDPDGRIAELLGKRDTWSGKTIFWPVEGTSLVVPVDLAALPTYTRTREFDGFRGFGIVRIGDATEDENAIGLTLTPAIAEDIAEDEPEQEQPPEPDNGPAEETAELPEPAADEAPPAEPNLPDGSEPADEPQPHEPAKDQPVEKAEAPGQPLSGRQIPSLLDWPTGERPALKVVENPGRRSTDKVIQIQNHRINRREGLTAVEQAAFREIARQLDDFVGRRAEENAQTGSPTPEQAENETADEAMSSPDQAAEITALAPSEPPSPPSLPEPTPQEPPPSEPAPQAEDPARHAGSTPEAQTVPSRPTGPDVRNPRVSDDPHVSDRELLSRMVPVRGRTGLCAEIVDQMPVALLVHSGDQLIHGNPEFLRLTGYGSLGELAEIGGLDALLQRQDLEGKTDEAGGMVVVRADDAVVPVTARLQSVRWGDASALMLALMPVASASPVEAEAVATNIIRQRNDRPADQLVRLQVEAEELRAILETATDGVVLIGAEGDIRSLNRAASALFNYDNEEINSKPFVTLFAHESQRAILDYLNSLAGHGVASVLNDGREVIGREASGGFLPLFMTIGRLTSSNGYCAVIRDITQWKRTEEELRTAKRAAETANAHKSDFLAHVSHEIRTPLNAIIGFADMIATERFGAAGHPRYVEYAHDIGRSGRHVLDIVNDLLDISKIEAGEMELDFIAVGLNETVSEAVSLVQPQANSQRVIIRTALSHSVPQVVADLRSVKQIVLNILSNAIRFTPSGGQIVVSTVYETNGNVVLRIRDTGIGMTRPELELAMKPFRQVAGGTRKRGDGTGLGLPLTKAMVDANRAAFSINSAPNEGTLVEITFPSPRVLAN